MPNFDMEKYLNELDILNHLIPIKNSLDTSPPANLIPQNLLIKPVKELSTGKTKITENNDTPLIIILSIILYFSYSNIKSLLLNPIHIFIKTTAKYVL